MYDDNWGCVEPSELFSSSGKTQSLKYLVEKLEQEQNSNNLENVTNLNRSLPLASTSHTPEDVKLIKIVNNNQNNSLRNQSRIIAPRILKKKKGLVERTPTLKRVTFEVYYINKIN